MQTKICRVVSQTDPIEVPSKKTLSGTTKKSTIRLRELGGDYEDEYCCTLFGKLAETQYPIGRTVSVALRFSTHENNGAFYQDIIANDVIVLER